MWWLSATSYRKTNSLIKDIFLLNIKKRTSETKAICSLNKNLDLSTSLKMTKVVSFRLINTTCIFGIHISHGNRVVEESLLCHPDRSGGI